MSIVTLPTVITAYDVETAIINTLTPRLAYYAPQMGYSEPRSYTRTQEYHKWPEAQLPAVVVTCPGLSEEPNMLGDKSFIARWLVGAGILVTARKEFEARKIAREYGALIRATILQQQSLGGFSRGVTWRDESYDQLAVEDRRTLASAEVMFVVEVGGVVNARELPYMPDMPEIPTPSGYTAEEVNVTVESMEGGE